jgi:hypothetical protein
MSRRKNIYLIHVQMIGFKRSPFSSWVELLSIVGHIKKRDSPHRTLFFLHTPAQGPHWQLATEPCETE